MLNQFQVKPASKIIGNYELLDNLGQGTFGRVKKARHILTGEIVAIKILKKERINDVSDIQRVSREIHILKLMRHPSIIQLYEIIQTPKQLFLVMEYFSNGQLFDQIVKRRRIKQPEACKLFQQFINGIEYIHKMQVVHRDLKPQNLLLDYDFSLKLVDFGLSSTYRKDQLLKTACGSPCYAAPQMINSQRYNGLKVDIWSSGVVLFAMICGFLPFQDSSTHKLYNKILTADYSFPNNIDISASCKDLIKKILTTDPEKRISIEQIRQHKWWNMSKQTHIPKGIMVGYNKIPVDNNIVQQLVALGFQAQHSRKCILANRHNHATTSYYLLLKKHLKSGGISPADLASPSFDQSSIEPVLRIKNAVNIKLTQQSPYKKQRAQSSYVTINTKFVPNQKCKIFISDLVAE